MAHDLARLRAAGAEAHAVDDVVQPALEQRQHVFAGDALLLRGLFEIVAELRFEHAVDAARLLLFAKLQAVADESSPSIFAVLPGNEVALFDGALLGVAALALQEQFHALAPAQPANGTIYLANYFSLPFLLQVQFTAWQAFVLLQWLPGPDPQNCHPVRFIDCRTLNSAASSADGSRCAGSA